MGGTESMHELMLSIFNIKLEANEVTKGLKSFAWNVSNATLFSHPVLNA